MTYHNILDALSDPTRRRIFERLARGPCAVSALSKHLPVSRPAVSQHLKILKQAGLVQDQALGARHIYRVDQEGLRPLRAWLDRLENAGLDAYREEFRRQLDERRHT